jgi:pentapeptide repeat protein
VSDLEPQDPPQSAAPGGPGGQTSSRLRGAFGTLSEPSWWIKDVVVAALIGGLLFLSQVWVDDARSQQDEAIENLRFVREKANVEGQLFAGFNLAGMNLSQLVLPGVDLNNADLSDARLVAAELMPTVNQQQSANLTDAKLCNADLEGANLTGAVLTGAQLSGANLTHTVLAGVDLRGADLTNVKGLTTGSFAADGNPVKDGQMADDLIYDDSTIWPAGFRPPLADEQEVQSVESLTTSTSNHSATSDCD